MVCESKKSLYICPQFWTHVQHNYNKDILRRYIKRR